MLKQLHFPSIFFDTNLFDYTTNYFQCYDVPLTNGVNHVTLRVSDRAGNMTTTNFNVTLDYSGATIPVLNIYWPQTNTAVVGTNFTWRGWVDDPTATVLAQITDTNGDTNIMAGEVERDGKVWVEDLPLTGGTNWLTLWVTNSAGYGIETNLPIMQSALNLTISPVTDDLWLPAVTVNGTFDDFADYTVWVNGVMATNTDGANWTAYAVPLPSGGTASIQARAISNTDNGGNGTGGNGGGPVSYDNLGNPDPNTDNDKAIDPDRPAEIVVGSGNWTDNQISNPDDWWYNTWGFTNQMGGTLYDDGWYDSDGETVDVTYGADQSVLDSTAVWHSFYGPDYETPDPIPLVMPYEEGVLQWGTASVGGIKKADVKMTLHTGGKGSSHRQNLFQLTPTATEETVPDTYDRVIPVTSISVAGKTVGADGNLWLAYPDNSSPDVTPQIIGGTPYYSFTDPTPQKYELSITANYSDTSIFAPAFCVGENITFSPTWSTTTPPFVDAVSHWTLHGLFVNEQPSPSIDDEYYDENTALLHHVLSTDGTLSTSCWYVKDLQSATASVAMYLYFSNGQVVYINTSGEFSVYRPKIMNFYPVYFGTPQVVIRRGYLTLRHHVMSFEHSIQSVFSGVAGYTQLVGGEWQTDPEGIPLDGTELDTGELNEGTVPVNPINAVPFNDAPQVPVSDNYTTTSEDLEFNTYLLFKPDAGPGPNIFVPLRLVTWELHDSASYIGGVLTPSGSATITGEGDTTDFPYWIGKFTKAGL